MNAANHTKAHSIMVNACREAILRDGRVQLWDNPTGFDARAKRSYGLGKGGADLAGLLKGPGRFFCVEVKTGEGDLTEDQAAWHRVVKKNGGFVTVARSVDDALGAISRAFKVDSHVMYREMRIAWLHFD